jgi:hypothetical protein
VQRKGNRNVRHPVDGTLATILRLGAKDGCAMSESVRVAEKSALIIDEQRCELLLLVVLLVPLEL